MADDMQARLLLCDHLKPLYAKVALPAWTCCLRACCAAKPRWGVSMTRRLILVASLKKANSCAVRAGETAKRGNCSSAVNVVGRCRLAAFSLFTVCPHNVSWEA